MKIYRSTVAMIALLAPLTPLSAQDDVRRSDLHDFRVVTVADGLEHPWSIAFLPGGDLLVTERPGRLRVIRNGVLRPEPVSGVPGVRARGQGGLLEVALHPDFESNRLIYLTFSKPTLAGAQATTALVRGRLEGDRLVDVEEIFEADASSRGGNHFGSRIVFDAAGYLFLTVGDRGASPFELEDHPAQHLTNHQGKVIRLHDDGRVPADNPFVGQDSALPEIWSFGHRNLQGLAIDADGNLWETEHGPQGGDELNLILPARNYGWPVIGFGVQYGGRKIHETTERAGMEQPVHYWVPSIATSGLMIYTGDRFPEWRGNAFVGGLAGRQIARVTLDGQKAVSEETLLAGFGQIRDIRQGPDGFIYIAFDGSSAALVRLEPKFRHASAGGAKGPALSRCSNKPTFTGERRRLSSEHVKVHELLTQVREGDSDALDRLIPLVFDELEELARVQRRRWHGSVSVHTGSLLNEAYMRLAGQESPQWRDRAHFMAVAATAMRQILIDHARRRGARKRGGDRHKVNFDKLENLIGASAPQIDLRDDVLLLLDECLTRLAKENERHVQIVECRFFAGMTIPETAEALGVSPATVKRGWAVAQAWLYREMRAGA